MFRATLVDIPEVACIFLPSARKPLIAQAHAEPIMLAFTNWEKKFVIEADASTKDVAAVLSQRNKHTGQLHPINFFSSGLSSAQNITVLENWRLGL